MQPNDCEDGGPLSESEIILEEQPIPSIEHLDLVALNDYSRRFRVSVGEQGLRRRESAEAEAFQEGIVELIARIQPSKLAIAGILETSRCVLRRHFPEDSKFRLRDEAKAKKILVISKLTTEQEWELVSQIVREVEKLQRYILLRQSQLGAVLFLEDNRTLFPPEQLREEYLRNHSEIVDFIVPPEQCLAPINFPIIAKILHYEYRLFDDFAAKAQLLQRELDLFEGSCEQGRHIGSGQELSITRILRELKILCSKLSTLVELFPYACLKPRDDLFALQPSSPRWQALLESQTISYKLYGEAVKVDASFNQLRTNLNIINATMNILSQARVNPSGLKYWAAQLNSIKKVLKCTVSSSVAHHEAELMISEPSEELAKEIWNLPEKKQFKTFIELTLPSIAFSEHLYIPRRIRNYFFSRIKNAHLPLPDYKITNLRGYFEELQVKGGHQERLSVRVNAPFELELQEFQAEAPVEGNFLQKHLHIMKGNIKNNFQSFKNAFKKRTEPPKTVIFHIHGGGFISMSSFIHQTYTRKWANALNVPIVSVDYGKAPEYAFPEGLYDCLEAYLWMLLAFPQVYRLQPERIVLVGDSAGGNLVAALTNLLIDWGLRVPDGIVLVYPALNLDYYDFTPSLLTALNDMILPHTFLKICLKSYLRDPADRPAQNHLISPIRAPAAILSRYPPTRIFVGSKDPFHDDCCRLAETLSKYIPGQVKMVIFEEFPHGFLQFDVKNSPHYYCEQATKEVEKALAELISK